MSNINYYTKYKKYKTKYFLLQHGGEDTQQLLEKMRDHEGKFVLVIGSNCSQPPCLEFANSPENRDKMVITLDLYMAIPSQVNNFKLDFNKIETWNILHEFDERFQTIIIDRGTEHYFHNYIDYIDHIKKLLMIGGKLYKYVSPNAPLFFPSYIPSHQIIRRFTEADINIIKHQYPNIPPESLDKIEQILYIRFTKSPYGLKRGLPPPNSSNYAIENVDIILKETYFTSKLEVPDMKWEINRQGDLWRYKNDSLGRGLNQYINSLFQFYEQLSESKILQELYKFKTDFFEKCSNYPLKYPDMDVQKRHTEDICFVVCTKQIEY